MVFIIPPVGLYNAKRAYERQMCDEDDDEYSLEKDLATKRAVKSIMIYWMVAWGLVLGVVCYGVWFWLVKPACTRARARKDGAKRVLESLHSDAIRSANTVNFSDCQIVSQGALERDSAHYAREIRRFVRKSGYDYLYWDDCDNGIRFDVSGCKYDLRRQQCANGYKQAVRQLAVQRRISNQK